MVLQWVCQSLGTLQTPVAPDCFQDHMKMLPVSLSLVLIFFTYSAEVVVSTVGTLVLVKEGHGFS